MTLKRKNQPSQTGRDIRKLSHRILEYASRGMLRIEFQKEVSAMILDFSGTDAVELWVREHGKVFRCRRSKHPGASSSRITSCAQDQGGAFLPEVDDSSRLFGLCHDIFAGRVDLVQKGFTSHGSFWTGDLKRSPGRRQRMDYPSLAVIPLAADGEKIGLLVLKSKRRHAFTPHWVKSYEEFAKVLGVALLHRRSQSDLRERVKELTCLYGIARLVAQPGISLDDILQGAVELLPPAWLYPDITSAKIVVDERSYVTSEFKESAHQQIAEIVVDEKRRGMVQVCYLEERPELEEGPFMKEERHLLDTVAGEVGVIIKRKETEADQKRLQEQLRHADRLATIGQLAAGVAHELNEPIGNILGFAQLAKKYPALPRQVEQDIEKILAASLNARDVIRKMLMFARQTPPQKRRVDLNQMVEEGLSFFEARCAKEGIRMVRRLDPGLPPISVDPVQMNQVLVNLVLNGIQAMPEGGWLTVETHGGEDSISVVIEDTGVGMSEEIRKQIFTPFFTTKDVGQGTGLGLPVVHGIVTGHGGTIHVESQVGRGTRFVVQLPIEGVPGDEGEGLV